jgi:hypothetical protein
VERQRTLGGGCGCGDVVTVVAVASRSFLLPSFKTYVGFTIVNMVYRAVFETIERN